MRNKTLQTLKGVLQKHMREIIFLNEYNVLKRIGEIPSRIKSKAALIKYMNGKYPESKGKIKSYNDAYDFIEKIKRSRDGQAYSGESEEAVGKRTELHNDISDELKPFQGIKHPVFPKIKRVRVSEDNARKMIDVSQRDPYDPDNRDYIESEDGKVIEVCHGAGKNATSIKGPNGRTPSGKKVDRIVTCYPRNNKFGRKNFGKGPYSTEAHPVYDDSGEYSGVTLIGSGRPSDFGEVYTKVINKKSKRKK